MFAALFMPFYFNLKLRAKFLVSHIKYLISWRETRKPYIIMKVPEIKLRRMRFVLRKLNNLFVDFEKCEVLLRKEYVGIFLLKS